MSDTNKEMQEFIAVKVARVLKHISTTHQSLLLLQHIAIEMQGRHLLETSAVLEEMLADMTEELKGLRRTQAAYEELRLRSLEGGII